LKRFGRERIEQLSRLEILCHGIKPEQLRFNRARSRTGAQEGVAGRTLETDAGGFKVHHTLASDTVMTIAATEHAMTDEFISLAKRLQEEVESSTVSDGASEPEEEESEEEDG